jgi:hypothetical protein
LLDIHNAGLLGYIGARPLLSPRHPYPPLPSPRPLRNPEE